MLVTVKARKLPYCGHTVRKIDGCCSVSGDTLQYRLEESVFHRRARQVTKLFTYLLTHNLFSCCI